MKILLAVLCTLLLSLLRSSQAESWDELSLPLPTIPPYTPPKRSECYYGPENRTLVLGENFTPKGSCMLATCVGDHHFTFRKCQVMISFCENPTIEEEDLTKPYPDCCAKAHCQYGLLLNNIGFLMKGRHVGI